MENSRQLYSFIAKQVSNRNPNPLEKRYHTSIDQNESQDLIKIKFKQKVREKEVKIQKETFPCIGYYSPKFDFIYQKSPVTIITSSRREKQMEKDNRMDLKIDGRKRKVLGYVSFDKCGRKDIQQWEGPHEKRFESVYESQMSSKHKKIKSFQLNSRKQREQEIDDRQYEPKYEQIQQRVSKLVIPFDKYTGRKQKKKINYSLNEGYSPSYIYPHKIKGVIEFDKQTNKNDSSHSRITLL